MSGGRGQDRALGEEVVADEDHRAGAEFAVQGRRAAPERCPIDAVIVDKGGGVEEFDAGGRGDRLFPVAAEGAGNQQEEERPEPLAATFHHVLQHLLDDRVLDPGRFQQLFLDQVEIRLHGFKDVRRVYFHRDSHIVAMRRC